MELRTGKDHTFSGTMAGLRGGGVLDLGLRNECGNQKGKPGTGRRNLLRRGGMWRIEQEDERGLDSELAEGPSYQDDTPRVSSTHVSVFLRLSGPQLHWGFKLCFPDGHMRGCGWPRTRTVASRKCKIKSPRLAHFIATASKPRTEEASLGERGVRVSMS